MTRTEIAKLLKSIAPPGQLRDKKIEAVKALSLKNNQGHGVHVTLDTYEEF